MKKIIITLICIVCLAGTLFAINSDSFGKAYTVVDSSDNVWFNISGWDNSGSVEVHYQGVFKYFPDCDINNPMRCFIKDDGEVALKINETGIYTDGYVLTASGDDGYCIDLGDYESGCSNVPDYMACVPITDTCYYIEDSLDVTAFQDENIWCRLGMNSSGSCVFGYDWDNNILILDGSFIGDL